jgi:ferredoxin
MTAHVTPQTMLVLNPLLCEGRGMCADAAPDLLELDEWGFPVLPGGGLRAVLSPSQLTSARAATDACPALALHVERRR